MSFADSVGGDRSQGDFFCLSLADGYPSGFHGSCAVESLKSCAEGGQEDSSEPSCQSPRPKGSADPSGLPGDFVQRPPIQTSADSLALRSTGLDVLIDTGDYPMRVSNRTILC